MSNEPRNIEIGLHVVLHAMDKATGHNNRLAKEKSPYLLQHAHNPVDWFPWGEEAFEKAARDDKPVFLSIGYSTCHWCHVMERESFADEIVGMLMNEAFVCVKVDREERPDIDGIYMTVCQMITGGGGWPLTIIMTPDRKPFFAATYFPKDSVTGRIGLIDLIPRIQEIWQTRRALAIESADKILEALYDLQPETNTAQLGEQVLKDAFEAFHLNFDSRFGGFGRAPKFPSPHNLRFLLRYWKRTGEPSALEMVEKTLRAMQLEGIYDHLGFGFHRYATDPQWLVPHFEKMLYDQALLAMAYTETFLATGRREYEQTAREIFEYALRDMADSNGAFYSAEDSDSDGKEGKYYQWKIDEIREVLDKNDAELAIKVFNIELEGNFIDFSVGRSTGANILYQVKPYPELAVEIGVSTDDLIARMGVACRKLQAHRLKRIHPLIDDKILTDWNGLMIAALAMGARAFGEASYTDAAEKVVRFVLYNMKMADGRLYRRYRDGEATVSGNVDDYAYMIWGLLELYEATFKVAYLREALALNKTLIAHFWDKDSGGFFFAPDDAKLLLSRRKEIIDGALPSGNSVAALNLLRLGRITGDPEYEETSFKLRQAFSGTVRSSPESFTQMLMAVDFAEGPSSEIVIVGDPKSPDTQAMLRGIRREFIPNKVVIFKPTGDNEGDIVDLVPLVRDYVDIDGKATAYVCLDRACDVPTTDQEMMLELARGYSSRRS